MMRLDLNIASSGESSSSVPEKEPFLEGSIGGEQMDKSGTSNSSVLNAEASSNAGDEDSVSTRTAPLQFGILKSPVSMEMDEDVEAAEVDETAPESVFITRQFFPPLPPAESAAVQEVLRVPTAASSSSSSRQHWVDLSFHQADIPPEVKILQQPLPQQQQQQVKKSRRGPRSRSSQYRGVTFYRRTGRWESHIWDCGKQVYLGGFDTAHAAARAYDRAAIKFRGVHADINFNLSDYDEDLNQTRNLSKEEFVHILRRQSTGFSRGSSKYRGVTLHKCGRWEARMGQFLGKKAYDKAAIKCNGRDAVTNFEPSTYEGETLPDDDSEAATHDLDLDLRISQPDVSSPKRGDNPTGIQFHCGSFEASDAKKARIDNPSSFPGGQPHRLAMAPEHSQVWTALYPGFFPTIEERTREKWPEVSSAPLLPNWAWQMHCPTQLPLYSSAASSGFSTTTATAAIPPPPRPPPRNLPFPPPPTTLYYSRS